MKRNLAGFIGLALLTLVPARALERPDKEFPIFQFPPTMIPRIDGRTDDWAIVPQSYVLAPRNWQKPSRARAPITIWKT